MKMKAAILWEPKTDWSVEEVDLDPPKAGEVLVQLVGSGLCHSDEHLLTGDLAMPEEAQKEMGIQQFPVIGGHEGAGKVVEVGPGVTSLKPGDHVVFGFIPSCGKCPRCSTGHQNLCDLGAYLLAGRQVTDFTARHHAKGQDLGIMCCIGTFGEYTVASQASCIKIEDDIPLDKAALVGCGVTTGLGLGRVRRRRAARRDRRRRRLRRRRHERRAGRVDVRRPPRHRRRPARVQARAGAALRRHPLGGVDRGGHRARRRPDVGGDGRQGDHHDGRRPGRVHPAGARR